MPRVSVLIATYNDEPFVGAAIESILAQTFNDFDIVVVDDASTDRSREVAAMYAAREPRIRLAANPTNLGPASARNRGLAMITSEYVAVLDGNDVCAPERLAEQVAYLDAHPEVAVVGSQGTVIDLNGRTIGRFSRPTTDVGIKWCRIFQSPVIQSSAMYRRAIVWDELGGYDERFRFGEDFELWRRVWRRSDGPRGIHNLPRTLVAYRADPHSLTGTPRHPARERYLARKAPMIVENLCDTLSVSHEAVTLRSVMCWFTVGDVQASPSGDDVREAVALIERSAARFATLYETAGGDRADARGREEVAAHQAQMLVETLRKAPAAGRLFMLTLWMRILRRDRRTALRAWLRFAVLFVCGEGPLRRRLDRRRRSAQRWREAARQQPLTIASREPAGQRPPD